MCGKKIFIGYFLFMLFLVPLQLVASKEAGGRMLTFSAQPVSTADLRDEWKDYKQKYVMLYSFAYAFALLK